MSADTVHVPYRFFRVETRNCLYCDQAESEADMVIAESNVALVCFDMTDLVLQGVALYDSINSLDNDWMTMVFEGCESYNAVLDRRIERLYRKWFDTSSLVLSLHSRIEKEYVDRGFDTDPVARLRSAVHEVKNSLADDADFFSHPRLEELRDAAIDAHQNGATEVIC